MKQRLLDTVRNNATLALTFLWWFIFTSTYLSAQQTPLKHYTMEDGLPSNKVYCMTRDSKGFLWFATDKGICRYDGNTFRSFSTYDGLPDNEIFHIKEDDQGRLWFATFNGDLCYYKDGIFHSSLNTDWLKLPYKSSIYRIARQWDGSVIFITQNVYKIIVLKDNKIKTYPIPLKMMPISYIIKTRSSTFKIVYEDGIIECDTTGRTINKQVFKEKMYAFDDNFSNSSFGQYIYTSLKGVYDLSGKLLFSLPPIKDNAVNLMRAKVIGDRLFIGLRDTLMLGSRKIKVGSDITWIENDISNNIWVTTLNSGIYYVDRNFAAFEEVSSGYPGRIIYAIPQDSFLFFSNNKGNFFHLKRGNIININESNTYSGLEYNGFTPIKPSGLVHFYKEKLFIWDHINTENAKLKKVLSDSSIHKANEDIKEALFDGVSVFACYITSIHKIQYKGLIGKEKYWAEKVVDQKDKNYSRIFSRIYDTSTKALWFSTSEGLYKVKDGQKILQQQFRNVSFRRFGFYSSYLVGITDKNKIIISNYLNGGTTGYLENNNCIWDRIYPVDKNHVLISTNNYHRLLTLYPAGADKKPKYDIITIENPFIPVQAEYITGNDQNFFFFKDGTITTVSTQLLMEKSDKPTLIFSTLKSAKSTYTVKRNNEITYNESKNITIGFDKIVFTAKDITCEYSISTDQNDNWNVVTGNEINLNRPGFGTYYIKIRAKTLSSGFSNPTVMTLIITAPFWASWWFIMIVVMVLILIIWLSVTMLSRQKVKKQQKQHEADMKYQQSEYKALNALMNPHFIFNSLNNIQGLINKNDKRVANEYLVIFSDLIRQNMHNISKGFITLQEELTLVENYLNLEKLRFKEFISYSISVAEDVETDLILIPPLMIQPLVENAVKHGLLPKQSIENKVSIKVFESLDKLYIEIEDNGVGLNYASKHSSNNLHESFGLTNLQKRTDHLKKIQKQEINIQVQELSDEHGKVLGTRAIVTMELGTNE